MTTTTRRAAAAARSKAVRSAADRPSARRDATTGARGRTAPLTTQLRAAVGDDGVVRLHGAASVVEEPYEMWDWYGPYTEVVSEGAFARTLGADPDTVLNVNHAGLPLARTISRTLQLAAPRDLEMDATLDGSLEDVRRIVSGIERGDITEMSFAFTITAGRWSPDWMEYRIDEVDINRGDVSIVTFGANPATTVGFAGLDDDVDAAAGTDDGQRSQQAAGLAAGQRSQAHRVGLADVDAMLRHAANTRPRIPA